MSDFHEQQALLPAAEVGGGGGGMQLFPIGGASMDGVISLPTLNPLPIQSPDNIFKNMNALGSTISQLGEQVCDHLGTSSAKGDKVGLELGAAEISQAKAPTFVSEAGIKEFGMVGGPQQGG